MTLRRKAGFVAGTRYGDEGTRGGLVARWRNVATNGAERTTSPARIRVHHGLAKRWHAPSARLSARMRLAASRSRDINETGRFSNGESTLDLWWPLPSLGSCSAGTRALGPSIGLRQERRDEIQDDVPKAVTQDDTPEVARLEDDESVEQSNREHEHEVDPVQEEDVKGCKDRGHVEEAAARAEAVHRPFQQDRAEDEFLGQARREEDHEPSEN